MSDRRNAFHARRNARQNALAMEARAASENTIRNALYDYAAGYVAPSTANTLASVLDFVPVLGDVTGAEDTRNAYNRGDYGEAAVNALATGLGVVPVGGDLAAAGVKALGAGALAAIPGAKRGIIAYHGSPHDFDRFSLDHIGTGEGAQAYGHGLYFAESPDVAKSYQPRNYEAEDLMMRAYKAAERRGDYLTMEAYERALLHETPAEIRAYAADLDDPAAEAVFRRVASEVDQMPRAGGLYQVNIDADPDEFLDWDAPLSAQPERVQNLASERVIVNEPPEWHFNGFSGSYSRPMQTGRVRIGEVTHLGGNSYRAKIGKNEIGTFRSLEDARAALDRVIDERGGVDNALKMRGRDVYDRISGGIDSLVHDTPNRVGATADMQAAGIPGIKYLDAGSRGAGDGSRNYVVFDDRLITILKKYGIGAAVAGGAYALTPGEYQAFAAEMQE